MKSSLTYFAAALSLAGLLGAMMIAPLEAQEEPKVKFKKPKDKLRECPYRAEQPKASSDPTKPIFYKTTWGNNPQEGQYRAEMERLLTSELANVASAVADVEKKHAQLIELYPQLTKYQEIIIEDVPGVWRDNDFVSSKKLIVFHYNKEKKLDCVVLDSISRSIYQDNTWTRKLLRLYYPNVQSMEMETRRHNFEDRGTLDRTSPEVQLKALRLVFLQLRTALYSMDMMIAAYYDRRNKRNFWQIEL